ncbi:MAG: endonuclease [Blastopirellula sp.]|nr:MAG: endonuclease [Blastopirellula sp.]
MISSRKIQWFAQTTLFVMALLAMFQSSAFSAEPMELRILTYNVHHGQGNDGKFDLERLAKIILKTKPDLVALQELDQKTGRSHGVDQPAEFAKLLGMEYVFAENLVFDGGLYGVAAYSRFPVVAQKTYKLPQLDGPEPRGIAEITVELPNKQKVRFLSTHWCHQSAGDRLKSAKFTNNLLKNSSDEFVIVTGDFNAQPKSDPIAELKKKWRPTYTTELLTAPSDNPRVSIDHVFANQGDTWKVKHIEVIQEKVASDHCPLLVVLEIAN